MSEAPYGHVKALVFDVFGTVVDWRGSIIREIRATGKTNGVDGDWEAFADRWRAGYHDGMNAFRSGEAEWKTADQMYRERLDLLLGEYGISGFSEQETDHLNKAWHRLDPWADAVEGLTMLKSKFVIGTLSNGNVGLLVNMAKYGGLPWDCVLAGELAGSYKPDPKVYLMVSELLGIEPHEVMMTAAHNHDLIAAKKTGLSTAFVSRPDEYGVSARKPDLVAATEADVSATDFVDLAVQLVV
ncbi:MAG: haloacid dehalogenase type II [Chloroflexi bacterium]|nr:haloacid dehalogenase type II [Chloroflexota bacterium]MDA1281837.1 haloacid dehalogenase type II [Chloroflexota bacterium]